MTNQEQRAYIFNITPNMISIKQFCYLIHINGTGLRIMHRGELTRE